MVELKLVVISNTAKSNVVIRYLEFHTSNNHVFIGVFEG